MAETGLEELTEEAREMLARLEERVAAEYPVPTGRPADRAAEASFRAERRQREGWPAEPPVFVPRPDPTVARGVEVTDPGLRASARLEHLRGWGGPDVLRAMGWADKAAELERLEAEHAARLNRVEALGRLGEEMAQLLPILGAVAREAERIRQAALRKGSLRFAPPDPRGDPVLRHQTRLRALRDLRRADRLRAIACREKGQKRIDRRFWKGLKGRSGDLEGPRNQRLPGGPEGA